MKMARSRKTGRKAAPFAGEPLKSDSSSKRVKTVAASDLPQAAPKAKPSTRKAKRTKTKRK